MTAAGLPIVRRDRELRAELVTQPDVIYALRKVEATLSGWGFVSRRSLLTGALRLTRSMAPEIADSLAHCRKVLGFEHPVEVFVKPEPVFNACAIRNASGPHIIVLSSHLLEAFTPDELRFVIGHELGHMALDHFGIPMPITASLEDMAGRLVKHESALKLFLWCRCAELSADRMGLICASDPGAAASGFFKLASGLSSPRVAADLEAYATQVESLASAPEARSRPRQDDDTLECFSTHPYSPVRVRAVVAFSRSRAYRQWTGGGAGDLDDEALEALIERDLALMNAGYLQEKSEPAKRARRVLYCAGLSVAAASGGVEENELRALRSLLGPDETSGAPDVTGARAELEDLLRLQRNEPLALRAQIVQHLTIIAAADGSVDELELTEMARVAEALGVEATLINETLRAAAHPMD